MKIFTLKKILQVAVLILMLFATHVNGQVSNFTITAPQTCYQAGANTATAGVVPANSSLGYTWTALTSGPSTACPVSIIPNGSGVTANFNFQCCGIYTINCAVYSANVLVTTLTNTYAVTCPPVISITNSGPGAVCAGQSSTLTASGATSYTWSIGLTGAVAIVTPTASSCYTVIGTTPLGCTAFAVSCQSIFPISILTVNGPTSTCAGSSADFTASGAATYTWNTVPPTLSSTVHLIASNSCNQYTISATDNNGCYALNTLLFCGDTMCAQVWPGDANSDGVVDNTDVLEIGLSYNATGTARSPGGNAFTSQYATTWYGVGMGSNGQNKVHIDCNGDGTVNMGDTVAIFNNYSLTHSFKSSANTSANPDITLLPSANVTAGTWNKADIILGSSGNAMSQLYGVAFDINFDNSMIQSNSAYVVYTSSFLNASTQNVQFRKVDFAGGKLHAASVRTNGTDVSGNGKIGEFWFKVKSGLPANSVLNLSTSNSVKTGKTGTKSVLTNGTTAPSIVASTVGLKENVLQNAVQFFPNPASNALTLYSSLTTSVAYTLYDVVGREITKGTFTTTSTLDLSTFQTGAYIIRFGTGSETSYKKLVIEKK